MAKPIKRQCPQCLQVKEFRADQKTCGCGVGKNLAEQNEITGDKWSITLPKTRIHTLEELIKFCDIDLSVWKVDRFIANKWEVGAKDNSGELQVEPLFQIKAFLSRRPEVVAAKKEFDELKRMAKSFAPLPLKVRKAENHSGYMLEINLSDHHFGKLAWGVETGGANYDTKIAADVFARAFNALLERTSSYSFEEIWFVVGNDLLNSDDTQGRTTKGTIVSTDVRFQKTFAVVRNLIISAIEKLRGYTKKVKVIMVSGNHDHLSVWHLGDSLECYFHKYSDVEIDNSPRYYKYHRFGQNMILFTHGDKGRKTDYPLLMATEQPEMFGQTKFREAHTGHVHTTRVEERHGVRVRVLPALCPPDAWHAENAFVGNLRSSEAFVWNKEEGLVGTAIYTDSDSKIEKASGEKQEVRSSEI